MTGAAQEATGTPREGEQAPGSRLAPGDADSDATPRSAVDDTRFAHHSEAEMARILDFYQVRWDYEPTTFPILWNLEGAVVESFAPDFYLPDFDVYLEMTTLKQRLVRKKNRKLRRLRALYPDIRIKLFYARDFRAMMLKYGRLGLAESLSGTPGQVVPVRAAPLEPAVAAPVDLADLGDLADPPITAEAIGDSAERATQVPAAEPDGSVATATPVAQRATPRARPGRRRRRATQASGTGAEREARA